MSGTKVKKEKPKTPKVLIQELTDENLELKQAVVSLQNELGSVREKYVSAGKQVLGALSRRRLKEYYNLTDSSDILSIGMDTMGEIIQEMTVKHRTYETSTEAQIEKVERHITTLSFDLARATRKTLAYEEAMDQMAKCQTLEEVKDKIYHMKFIANRAYQSFQAEDPVYVQEFFPPVDGVNGPEDRPDLVTTSCMEDQRKLNLVAPTHKKSGETPVAMMNQELRLFLILQLSYERPSGADWRKMAERAGICLDTIASWQKLKLAYPMSKVFEYWDMVSDGTVRTVHRHLISPEMRAMILAKQVANFYNVD